MCQSSEMFYLSLEERVALAKAVVKAAGGRLDVIVSGRVSDSPHEQVRELRAMARTGAQAVVLVTNRMAGEAHAYPLNTKYHLALEGIPNALMARNHPMDAWLPAYREQTEQLRRVEEWARQDLLPG